MNSDFSKDIYEKYFNKKDRILQVTLKNGTSLKGIFVSFTHGDPDGKEPYITKWHFVPEEDIENYRSFPHIDFGEEYGQIINQSDIENVTFK